MIYPPLDHPLWFLAAAFIGACVGSFLNVVIHRLPLGRSVNDPKRSFCPHCQTQIPWSLNLPVISWCLLRGRCRWCHEKISIRYLVVEVLTAIVFVAVWWVVMRHLGAVEFDLSLLVVLPLWFLVGAFIAITFIDAEHLVIPLELTIATTLAGLIGVALWPELSDLCHWRVGPGPWWRGLVFSGLGFVVGFFGLWAIVLLGKLAFGRVEWKHDRAVDWSLQEPQSEDEPIIFQMGEEQLGWWDIFYRKSDRLRIEAEWLEVDGVAEAAGEVVIREDGVVLPSGRNIAITELQALRGTAKRAVVPREAMGMGDVHLMGAIGAFFGPFGVFFSLFAASLYAIVVALLGRVGFGVRLPFGPFLVFGALTWLFGGWRLAEWYFGLVR